MKFNDLIQVSVPVKLELTITAELRRFKSSALSFLHVSVLLKK